MSTAAKYKRHAADCLRLAQSVSASGDRVLLIEMAAMWLRLADRAELIREQASHQQDRNRLPASD
jgi:hypothetical protein